ncbi:MAG TPA: hypothetical protein VFR47_15010 [Anaerolineales bacterium]|nr:hypothetical protein [Anaerolineales bacterium]
MKKYIVVLLAFISSFFLLLAAATSANASNTYQADVLEHGEYIANIAGCIDCHTPFQEEYQDPTKMTLEQLKTFSFNLGATQDQNNGLLAGGRAFDLGPAESEDTEAVAYYLKNVLPAVKNEIPAPSLNEGFEEIAPLEQNQLPDGNEALLPVILVVVGVAIILLVSIGVAFPRRRSA